MSSVSGEKIASCRFEFMATGRLMISIIARHVDLAVALLDPPAERLRPDRRPEMSTVSSGTRGSRGCCWPGPEHGHLPRVGSATAAMARDLSLST